MGNQIDYLILGYDGYIGYPLTVNLISKGYLVVGVDNLSRRERAKQSLTPITSTNERFDFLHSISKNYVNFFNIDLIENADGLREILRSYKPKTIIHLAQQPSAPWSMQNFRHAAVTQYENVMGTLHLLWAMRKYSPESHLIKLGTMGEYGTPPVAIPEGEIPKACISGHYEGIPPQAIPCSMAGMQFPRAPGSFYHASKVFDSINIKLACDLWGLKCTDIMQGIVYGVEHNTRFDYDQHFGTVINRLCAQAVAGLSLTIYGKGNQTRGFLPLSDSLKCIELITANPPEPGEYDVINQFGDILSINRIANIISATHPSTIQHIPNPRVEDEDNTDYDAYNSKLTNLGYVPSCTLSSIRELLAAISPYKNEVIKDHILPTTTWR